MTREEIMSAIESMNVLELNELVTALEAQMAKNMAPNPKEEEAAE